jgi:GTP cyclohydrolase I
MSVVVDVDRLRQIGRDLLEVLGEDPERPELIGTPDRFARAWREFIDYDRGNADTTFDAVEVDQMVVVRDMRVYSYCEHHLLPFWCDVSIGYITGSKVIGLSKFARIAHNIAHRLQIQERLVAQIADEVQSLSGSPDVAVIATGVHTCMVMRGIRTDGTMTTSVMRGVFRENPSARSEILQLLRLR